MHTKRVYSAFDFTLAVSVVLVSIFGIVLLASATQSSSGELSDDFVFQILWVVTGIIIMLAASFIDYKFICRFYKPIYLVNIILLVAVWIFGRLTHRETYRWIGIGSFGILPSEFSKVFMIVFLATLFDKLGPKINKLPYFLMVAGLTLLPTVLILIEPSLSACLVIVMICVFMLYAAKLKYRYFIAGILILVPLLMLVYYDVNSENPIILDKIVGYQRGRIETFFNPDPESDEYFQTHQSMRAIATGRLTGKGLFNNDVVVPASSNDFIVAVLGSEFGFAGCVVLLGFMFFIIFKCLLTAKRSEVFVGKLIAVGAASMIAFQVFVNVGVATGMLPNTGMTLPFISSGGSSIWVSFACIGLVINVGMTKTKLMFEE